MCNQIIKLNPEEVGSFVEAASRCDFDIDISNVSRAEKIVDAKSFLGVMGLNFRENLKVSYNGSNGRFEKLLEAKRA